MTENRRKWPVLLAVVVLSSVACGPSQKAPPAEPGYSVLVSPGTSEPRDELERSILAKLSELPADAESTIEGRTVIAGRVYAAASGRTCRSIIIHGDDKSPLRNRLACRMGEAWAFVPDAVRRPGEAQ